MATDPTPLLSTIAGASSGLVAIVGGLLVAKFISLDSEQQGAQRVLDDAEARLAAARQRAEDAAERLLRWSAREFLDDQPVVQALLEGVTDLAELRRQGDQTSLTDEQLAPFVEEVRGELARAVRVLDKTIPASEDVEAAGWDAFRRRTPSLPETGWELAWELVFELICERRAAERAAAELARAAERARAAELARIGGFPAFAGLAALSMPTFRLPTFSPDTIAGLSNTDWQGIRARRRDELAASHERAQQHVEDVEGEVQRFRQARDAIVRPQGLGWALAILGYFTAVGVVVPILLMSRAPKDLTPHMGGLLFAGFCSGLVALLGYMAALALRLSRRRSAPAKLKRY